MAEIIKTDGRWQLKGDLCLADIEAMLAHNAKIDDGPALEIDLSAVHEVDTTALSLLFEWQRQAERRGRRLVYSHLPSNLLSLATLYGVLEMISQAPHQASSI